ncbi:GNAT family N-acetyltransferase [Dasania marina]|uniref:GNAT family N-acetyltransferase n=1 Tax=Dasania marina TaxID=471499 RepID=UPI000368B378|nr:GNAT family N-acetyltransferase [Dasania marina]
MKAIKPLTVATLTAVQTPLANKFYRKYGFRGKAKRHEPCVVVRDEHNAIIACAYLRNYKTINLLAGVAVAPAYQGQGVARLLLNQLVGYFDQRTYTFPYQHLQSLYASLGFALVAPDQQAETVSDIYYRYREQGRPIVMMLYQPRPSRTLG